MSWLFRSIGVVGWAYRSALAQSLNPRLWLPFFCIAATQGIILALLVWFYKPGLQGLVLPVVTLVGGEGAAHYPVFFYYLPTIFSRSSLFVGILVTSLASGAATLIFARAYGHDSGESPWRYALRRYPALLIISALLTGATYGVSLIHHLIPQDLFLENNLVRWGFRGGMLFLLILVQAFLIYGAALVVLSGHRALPAIRDSIRVTARTLLPTFIAVGVPILILFPLIFLTSRVDLFATKLLPETVVLLLVLRIVLEMVLGFALVGAVTRMFLWRMVQTP